MEWTSRPRTWRGCVWSTRRTRRLWTLLTRSTKAGHTATASATAAAAYLAARPRPAGVEAIAVEAASGTPDGRTAVVVLTGRAVLPMTGGVLAALGRSVTITVDARARAPLRD